MSAADPRAACIIGVARHTWHPDDCDVRRRRRPGARAARHVGARRPRPRRPTPAPRGGADALLGALESIDVVYSQSWQYDDAAARLAERLGASPARRRYSGIGGSVPHVLAAEAAQEIRAGNLDLALLTGAEALATVRRLKKAGEKPAVVVQAGGEAALPDGHGVRPLGDQPLGLRGVPDLRAVRQRAAGAPRAGARRAPGRAGPGHGGHDVGGGGEPTERTPGSPWRARPTRSRRRRRTTAWSPTPTRS